MPSLFTFGNCLTCFLYANEQLGQNNWFCYAYKQWIVFKDEILDQNGQSPCSSVPIKTICELTLLDLSIIYCASWVDGGKSGTVRK